MTDDLVKRLRVCAAFDPDQAEAADRIEKLEASEAEWQTICDSYAAENQRFSDHIEKLEAALQKIKDLHHGPEDDDVLWIRDDMTYKLVCDTLEGKDD
jgi:chromosome segregation ATPase